MNLSETDYKLMELLAPKELVFGAILKDKKRDVTMRWIRKSKGQHVVMNTDQYVTFSLYERVNDTNYIADVFSGLDGWDILGSPPQLHHLLVKLGEKAGKWIEWHIDCYGNLFEVNTEKHLEEIIPLFVIDLTKDILGQTEETKKEILKLLAE